MIDFFRIVLAFNVLLHYAVTVFAEHSVVMQNL